jgi:hypothetical protein
MSTSSQTAPPQVPEEPAGPSGGPGRRRVLVVAVVALVVAGLVVLGILTGGEDRPDTTAAARTTAPATGGETAAEPTAAPSGDTAASPTGSAVDDGATTDAPADAGSGVPAPDPAQAPPSLAPVALEAPVVVDGVVVSVTSIEAIDGAGQGPGNVAGPALRVTVHLENRTDGAIPVDGVAVSVAYGPELTPASPLEDPSRFPFGGSLGAGAEADGVYVFTVPADQRDAVTISVGYIASAPIAVFTGATD